VNRIALAITLVSAALAALASPTLAYADPCSIDMVAHDGQSGKGLTDPAEFDRGVFTVLNENDSDATNGADIDDTTVTGEVDLMKIALYEPSPSVNGHVAKLEIWRPSPSIPPPGDVKLWTSSDKTTQLTGTTEFFVTTYTFVIDDTWPKIVWAEGTQVSGNVRDLVFIWRYDTPPAPKDPCSDRARATIVWGELHSVKHDATDANWADLVASGVTKPAREALDLACQSGFGLRAVAARPAGARNCIAFNFKPLPLGIKNEPDVRFDITRQIECTWWFDDGSGWDELGPMTKTFPTEDARANDDPLPEVDESTAPNDNHSMFSIDGPGPNSADRPPSHQKLHVCLNFREFLRVRFDGKRPSGNRLDGTRSSPKVEWHARHRLDKNAAGNWARTTGDAAETATNDVGLGHVAITAPPGTCA
jgi:hypothetical protein